MVLYFSFAAVSRDFMYQVNMWIETLEELDRRPVIILREQGSFRRLSRTWLPVVCVPGADDLAELELTPIRAHADHVPGAVPVVLYAPAWEGWSDDDCHTSLIPMGVTLVEQLLAQQVRVIYKPHPLTGRRSQEADVADRAVRALLSADNERRGTAGTESQLAGRHGGDCTQQTRDAHVGDPDAALEWHALRSEWHRLFRESHGSSGHHVVRAQLPTLYACFNETDILISDVSSVVADFVASLKPYVLTNALGLSDEAFRTAYTTAGGAYLLDRDCGRLSEILRSVREPRHDPRVRCAAP